MAANLQRPAPGNECKERNPGKVATFLNIVEKVAECRHHACEDLNARVSHHAAALLVQCVR